LAQAGYSASSGDGRLLALVLCRNSTHRPLHSNIRPQQPGSCVPKATGNPVSGAHLALRQEPRYCGPCRSERGQACRQIGWISRRARSTFSS
jgi:hypothetical protein